MFKKNSTNSTSKNHHAKRYLTPKFKTKQVTEASEDQSPRITNETIIEHREAVLSKARKYIYPLSHSRRKIVVTTVSLVIAVVLAFMTYIVVNLYKMQTTTAFMYQITKVIPLPIARIGGTFVSYENYLFELRHYIHYFESQQEIDFTSDAGKAQLKEQKKKSLENVVNYAYIKKIAAQKGISVSGQEVDGQIEMLRGQNKLGSDNQVFKDVLRDYWGWSVSDFRRSIYQELLTSKVLKTLDTDTLDRANGALAELKSGSSFADVTKKYSDDTATKDNGGQYGFLISSSSNNVPSQTIDTLFKLKAGETSQIIDIGYGLEIVKCISVQDDKVEAARIFFAFSDINSLLNDYKAKQPAQVFIKV
jgi:parvulin-like peptidyl-prolyl isomerase